MYKKLSHAVQGKHFQRETIPTWYTWIKEDKRKQRLQLFSLHILYYCAYPGLWPNVLLLTFKTKRKNVKGLEKKEAKQ